MTETVLEKAQELLSGAAAFNLSHASALECENDRILIRTGWKNPALGAGCNISPFSRIDALRFGISLGMKDIV